MIREGPLNPGTFGLYWRFIESLADGAAVRSYGIKSKTRVSNSKTGFEFERTDDGLLVDVG